MSINFGIPPYPPEKLQKVGGKMKRQENTPKNKKNRNPGKLSAKAGEKTR